MQRISSHLGIEQGQEMLFTDFADNGPMWVGTGPREVRHRIRFAERFAAAPAVMVGISLWDVDTATNLRADLRAEAVKVDGFTLVFRTWGDSRLARLRAEWTAIGALRDDELWEVD